MSKYLKTIIKFVIACLMIGGIIAVWLAASDSKSSTKVYEGKIKEIKTMVQLCAIEVYNEVTIKDTIDNKILCGIQKQRVGVAFDIENLEFENEGDTVIFMLPPEIIEPREMADTAAWEVIYDDGLTVEKVNKIKNKAKERSKRMLYHDGTVRRARKEGAENLRVFMEKICRKPVKVIDPTPDGAHYAEYQ